MLGINFLELGWILTGVFLILTLFYEYKNRTTKQKLLNFTLYMLLYPPEAQIFKDKVLAKELRNVYKDPGEDALIPMDLYNVAFKICEKSANDLYYVDIIARIRACLWYLRDRKTELNRVLMVSYCYRNRFF